MTLPGRVPAEPGHARPPGGDHVKARSIGPADHAGEATAIEGDSRQPLATFGHPHAILARHVGVPGRSLGIQADSVWRGVAQVGPHPMTGQAASRTDVEAEKPMPIRVGDTSVRLSAVTAMPLGNAMSCATVRAMPLGVTRATKPGRHRACRWTIGELEVSAVDVGVTVTVDHNVV